MKKHWLKWTLCALLAVAILAGGWYAAARERQLPIVYAANGELRVHDGRRGRTVNAGYNSDVITAATQLSEDGKTLCYIAPAGIAGTLYRADTAWDAQGPGQVLAENVSAVKQSGSGKAVVYQNPALELYTLEKGKPRRVDTSVREVLAVSDGYVLYSKYSTSAATGQALYLCRLKASAAPKLVADDFEVLLQAEDDLSAFYYQTKTPDLGSDPSCHNLFSYRSSRSESKRLLRNVAEIYEVGGNGTVLFSVKNEAGLSAASLLTDPMAEADAALKAPQPGSEGYNAALAAYQQKQLRDAARSAVQARLDRVVKMDVYACKPEDYGAVKPAATYIGDISVLAQGEGAVFFSLRDWSGVSLTLEEVMTPAAREKAVAQKTALTFSGVTAKGDGANLCKTAKGVFLKEGFAVDFKAKTARFLGYSSAAGGEGTLYEASFASGKFAPTVKKAGQVTSFSANGLCMEMQEAGGDRLYAESGVPIRFDGSVIPSTSPRLLSHTDHCCAAFYPGEESSKSYTLYSIRNGKADFISESAGGTLYFRGETEFLYIEQADEATGRGRLVLCSPHRAKPENIQLDTGVTDVLCGTDEKISLTSS